MVTFHLVNLSSRAAEQHPWLVYGVLGERMREEIHALSIKAYTPDEI